MKTHERKRRSDYVKTSKEGQVLKFFRTRRGLSMRKAASLIGKSDTYIAHAESGRLDLTIPKINELLLAYEISYKDFNDYLCDFKELPVDLMDECKSLLAKLPKEKLVTVKTIIKGFL